MENGGRRPEKGMQEIEEIRNFPLRKSGNKENEGRLPED